ncbi:unnamed protein product [Trichobilharzia regenti]|nr:unnamed protein product [Trichobilharzia regenti]
MGKPSGPAPQVNGISPNEGTPGTKLTIRGENLGNTASDLLHVFIGGIDVGRSAQWFSHKKITAITPLGEGELEIVVVTDSGGFGTAAVTYQQNCLRVVGPGSVHLADKDFDPVMFLLKFYKNSNYNDLLVTVKNFRQSMGQEGPSEPVNVIRTNLVLIFRCLDGMDSISVSKYGIYFALSKRKVLEDWQESVHL